MADSFLRLISHDFECNTFCNCDRVAAGLPRELLAVGHRGCRRSSHNLVLNNKLFRKKQICLAPTYFSAFAYMGIASLKMAPQLSLKFRLKKRCNGDEIAILVATILEMRINV